MALIVEGALAGLAGMDVGVRAEHYVWAAPYALGAGVVVALAGLAGYGILAKVQPAPRLALIGILAVPVALGLSVQVINSAADASDERARTATAEVQQAHLQDLCATLTLSVKVAAVDYTAGGGIDRLTLDFGFASVGDVTFDPDAFVTSNQVAYSPNLPDLHGKLTTGLPIVLKAGQAASYSVALTPRPEDSKPKAGAWRATVWLSSTDGETYICRTPEFVVPPAA